MHRMNFRSSRAWLFPAKTNYLRRSGTLKLTNSVVEKGETSKKPWSGRMYRRKKRQKCFDFVDIFGYHLIRFLKFRGYAMTMEISENKNNWDVVKQNVNPRGITRMKKKQNRVLIGLKKLANEKKDPQQTKNNMEIRKSNSGKVNILTSSISYWRNS